MKRRRGPTHVPTLASRAARRLVGRLAKSAELLVRKQRIGGGIVPGGFFRDGAVTVGETLGPRGSAESTRSEIDGWEAESFEAKRT
jgi:hypothetical protein